MHTLVYIVPYHHVALLATFRAICCWLLVSSHHVPICARLTCHSLRLLLYSANYVLKNEPWGRQIVCNALYGSVLDFEICQQGEVARVMLCWHTQHASCSSQTACHEHLCGILCHRHVCTECCGLYGLDKHLHYRLPIAIPCPSPVIGNWCREFVILIVQGVWWPLPRLDISINKHSFFCSSIQSWCALGGRAVGGEGICGHSIAMDVQLDDLARCLPVLPKICGMQITEILCIYDTV